MRVNRQNPYEGCGATWVKGNLHAHFSPQSPCAVVSRQDLIEAYSRKGYAFLGISNHLRLPDETSFAGNTRLLLLPGTEWNSRTPYMDDSSIVYQDHYGIYTTKRDILAQCLAAKTPGRLLAVCRHEPAVFCVLHHPNWLFPAHTTPEALLVYGPRAHALEIYNAGIEREPGEAVATHAWDILLGSGAHILGVVGDDAHRPEDVGKAWLAVAVDRADSLDREAILASLVAGRFYCSTGVTFASIQRNADTLTVTGG